MRRLLIITAVLALASTAAAQLLPGLGGSGEEPAVRLADPKEQLAVTARAIETRRQAVMLRQADVDRWQRRRLAIAEQLDALDAQRAEKVLAEAPSEADRRWRSDRLGSPAPTPDRADAGAGDGDAGVADGGAGDAGVTDAGGDAGAGDGGARDAAASPPSRQTTFTLPQIEADGGWLAPGIHPAEVEELDHHRRALRSLEGILAGLIRLHGEESGQLAAALGEVERMQRTMAEGRAHDPGLVIGLRDVERLALDSHKAHIEVALARARERQSAMDDADAAEAVGRRRQGIAELAPLDAGGLEPWAAFAGSFGRAEGLRERTEDIRRESFEHIEPLGRLTERVAAARQERRALETRHAHQRLDADEAAYAAALEAMEITPEDIEQAEAIFERSKSLRAKNMPPLEEQLDDLRVIGAGALAEAEGLFDTARLKRTQRTVVGETLFFERIKLQRDAFRRDLVVAVRRMLDDNPPDPAFVTTWAPVLDAEQMAAREADRETRCEGWRRAHGDLRKQAPPPSQRANAEALDALHTTLDDLCGRENLVLATQSRLAEIGRHHLERFHARGRGIWWYAGRGALTALLLALLLWLSRFLGRLTSRLSGRHTLAELRARPGLARLRSIGALALYLAALAGLWLGLGLWVINHIWALDLDLDWLGTFAVRPMFIIGDSDVSLWSLVRLIMWTLAAIWGGRLVQRFSADLMEHFAVEATLRDTLATLVRYLTVAVGIAVGLSAVGIGFGALAVFFGVIGIGIGFGLQTIANNFISGFIILLERPIRKGDFVEVDGMVGEVIAIKARATTIETRDGVTVIVPNSEFVGGRVINWTLGRGDRVRGSVSVGVAYGTDLEQATALLLDVARGHSAVLDHPEPDVRLTGFGDSSLDLVLHFWSRDIRGLPSLQSDLNRGIDAAFRAHAIEIPYPREDVSIRDLPPGWGDPGD